MSRREEEDLLSTALASQPRRTASPGFTLALLGRLERRQKRRRHLVLGVATAVAVTALALLLLVPARTPASRARQLNAQAQELRQEQLRLQRELEELRSLAEQTAPVLYLGQDPDGVDIVLDIGPLLASQTAASVPATHPIAQPADLR